MQAIFLGQLIDQDAMRFPDPSREGKRSVGKIYGGFEADIYLPTTPRESPADGMTDGALGKIGDDQSVFGDSVAVPEI